MEIRKIRVGGRIPTLLQLKTLKEQLEMSLRKRGYLAYVYRKNRTSLGIQGGIRVTKEYREKLGLNVSGYSGKRTSYLGWLNYLVVNETINDILDAFNMSANVDSLHGKFIIRRGMKRYTEEDWEDSKHENVGSRMRPCARWEHNMPYITLDKKTGAILNMTTEADIRSFMED